MGDEKECVGEKRRLSSNVPIFKCQWSEEMHKGFLAAIFDIGLSQAKPKDILKFWSSAPQGIHSEHIKSHLQKYRKNAKRTREVFNQQLEAAINEALFQNKKRALTPHLHAYPICAAKEKKVTMNFVDDDLPPSETGRRKESIASVEKAQTFCHSQHQVDEFGCGPGFSYSHTHLHELRDSNSEGHHYHLITHTHTADSTESSSSKYGHCSLEEQCTLDENCAEKTTVFEQCAYRHPDSHSCPLTTEGLHNHCSMMPSRMHLGAFEHEVDPTVEPSLCPFGSPQTADDEELFSYLSGMENKEPVFTPGKVEGTSESS